MNAQAIFEQEIDLAVTEINAQRAALAVRMKPAPSKPVSPDGSFDAALAEAVKQINARRLH